MSRKRMRVTWSVLGCTAPKRSLASPTEKGFPSIEASFASARLHGFEEVVPRGRIEAGRAEDVHTVG